MLETIIGVVLVSVFITFSYVYGHECGRRSRQVDIDKAKKENDELHLVIYAMYQAQIEEMDEEQLGHLRSIIASIKRKEAVGYFRKGLAEMFESFKLSLTEGGKK